MKMPRVGVGLPIVGPHAGPAAIMMVATAADRLGYSCVSTADRLLLPLTADWTNVYGLPDYPSYDALESLTWVAAQTERVRLVPARYLGVRDAGHAGPAIGHARPFLRRSPRRQASRWAGCPRR